MDMREVGIIKAWIWKRWVQYRCGYERGRCNIYMDISEVGMIKGDKKTLQKFYMLISWINLGAENGS